MKNLYEYNRHSNFEKLECDGILFVEFQCMPGDICDGIWSQYGHIEFVLSGRKIWITPDGEFPVGKGDALYCKKGGHLIQNYFEDNFCALLFFFPDNFIRETVLEFRQGGLNVNSTDISDSHIIEINVDLNLSTFFESVRSYFLQKQSPSKHLLKLRFKELILQLLTSNQNSELAAYFLAIAKEEKISIRKVMQDNFLYRLSLNDYAELCHRSLSTFKRDFQETFKMAPGKWLNLQRMKYAKIRLLTTDESINDVAFHSGFETTSHFIRCFKKFYGLPPHRFRQQQLLLAH